MVLAGIDVFGFWLGADAVRRKVTRSTNLPPIFGLPESWVIALLIGLATALVIGAAWAFQASGYAPCELCLLERIPYYVGMPVAVVTAVASRRGYRYLALAGFAVLVATFAASTALGLYHVGVEWRFWPGPTECSGALTAPPNVGDFLEQLHHVAVVRCDQPALTIVGLSLAGWNVVASIILLALANAGILRRGFRG